MKRVPPRYVDERPWPWPPLLLAGLIALVWAASLIVKWQLPLPGCGMRKVTGLPCPLCGTTRAFLAWSHFDIVGAFQFNPMVFLGCLGIYAWFTLWLIDQFFDKELISRFRLSTETVPLIACLFLTTFLNWIYLCFTLPD